LIVIIPSEDTRSQVGDWKTGFYRIAVGVGVPIGLSFLGFSRKTDGFLPIFYHSGNAEQDIPKIQSFYKDIPGKYSQP